MYTYIKPEAALPVIADYLRNEETQKAFPHYNAKALIAALEIVMLNSTMRCGDVFVKQTSGTAMGKPCAPPWAILFEGLHERDTLLPLYGAYLTLYLRFIDDVFSPWDPQEDPIEDDRI